MSARPPTPKTELYALLIGVNRYEYHPDGDLRAPCNDVVAWLDFLLRTLGVPAENIQVLTSPALTTAEVVCQEATAENVAAACAEFSQRSKSGFGFVFVAGHGDFTGHGRYALRLSQWQSGAFEGDDVVNNQQLSLSNLWQQHPGRITVLADVCRPPKTGNPGLGWQVDSKVGSSKRVVLAGASFGRGSYERKYEDGWHGQLTWSALSILLNWPVGQLADGPRYVQISARVLSRKLNALVRVFNHPDQTQTPTLFTPCPTGPFLLPGVRAQVSAYAVDAVPHEFQPGTSDFWWKAANGTVTYFGKVVVDSTGTGGSYSFTFVTDFQTTVKDATNWGVTWVDANNGQTSQYTATSNHTYQSDHQDLGLIASFPTDGSGAQAGKFYGWLGDQGVSLRFWTSPNNTSVLNFGWIMARADSGRKLPKNFSMQGGALDWHAPPSLPQGAAFYARVDNLV